jgi:CMP-N-acetylneuraminic acid synthetase
MENRQGIRTRVREMIQLLTQPVAGKIDNLMNLFSGGSVTRPLVDSIDYTLNDYDLSKAVYYASLVNGKGKDILLAGPFGKNIVNALASFTIGQNYKYDLPDNEDAQQDLNDWITSEGELMYDFTRWGLRDGDSYLYLDELGELYALDPDTVNVILDPITGVVIGYDVQENVCEIDTDGNEEDFVYLKQYRQDSTQILKYPASGDQSMADQIYQKLFFDEGDQVTSNGQVTQAGNTQSNAQNRPLPIIHFANDSEPRSVYGNSEFQNLYVLFMQYHRVLKKAIENNLYNNDPILLLMNAGDPNKTQASSQTDDDGNPVNSPDKTLKLGSGSVLYGKGTADAKFVQANGTMADTSALLGTLFNLVVQGSETPEFIFGAAVASSNASTNSQMPAFLKKAERKRQQLQKSLLELGALYIYRQNELSNPLYLSLPPNYALSIDWPTILTQDSTVDVAIVTLLLANTAITTQTAAQLLLGDRLKDPEQEVKDAEAEAAEQAKTQGDAQFEHDRLLQELAIQMKVANATPVGTVPAKTVPAKTPPSTSGGSSSTNPKAQ